MDTYNHQKLPANQAVANTPPNQAACLREWASRPRLKGERANRAMRAKPAANSVKLKTCNQPRAWPLLGQAMDAACAAPAKAGQTV
jgi:hypothetical protein